MQPDQLSVSCDPAALLASRNARWRPGLAAPAHSEILASGREGAGAGFALALARDAWRSAAPGETTCEDDRAVLWVQDRATVRLTGRPYRPGLPTDLRHRLIHVVAEKPEDALFALEEGLRCRELAFVIGAFFTLVALILFGNIIAGGVYDRLSVWSAAGFLVFGLVMMVYRNRDK